MVERSDDDLLDLKRRKATASALGDLATVEAQAKLARKLVGTANLYVLADALHARRAASHTLSAEEEMWLKVAEWVRARYNRSGHSNGRKAAG